MNRILVVGSVGYDCISTPKGHRDNILGGSANYFSLAASHFAKVRVVGVVGEDYKSEHRDMLLERGVDLSGMQTVAGRTFAWEGRYEGDMNEATTLATHLNVFEKFHPTIPTEYRDSEVVFLANIDPELQLQVLEQIKAPRLVAADTMNYWIQSKKPKLLEVLKRIDIVLLNESELRQLTDEWNTIKAVQMAHAMGPKVVVVKRGEYGFVLSTSEGLYILPAFPVSEVVDPTGAGDTFAGGFLGYLAGLNHYPERADLKRACVEGCVTASFTVQDFGVEGVRRIQKSDLQTRRLEYQGIIT
jgi:sugar/nucleoside kinase (ribokinase family)